MSVQNMTGGKVRKAPRPPQARPPQAPPPSRASRSEQAQPFERRVLAPPPPPSARATLTARRPISRELSAQWDEVGVALVEALATVREVARKGDPVAVHEELRELLEAAAQEYIATLERHGMLGESAEVPLEPEESLPAQVAKAITMIESRAYYEGMSRATTRAAIERILERRRS